jgi:hypothetical protein
VQSFWARLSFITFLLSIVQDSLQARSTIDQHAEVRLKPP